MAYKIPIVNNCESHGCPRMATHIVITKQQATEWHHIENGRYCEQCADALIEKLNAESVAHE